MWLDNVEIGSVRGNATKLYTVGKVNGCECTYDTNGKYGNK